jgi:hypothetical protein
MLTIYLQDTLGTLVGKKITGYVYAENTILLVMSLVDTKHQLNLLIGWRLKDEKNL